MALLSALVFAVAVLRAPLTAAESHTGSYLNLHKRQQIQSAQRRLYADSSESARRPLITVQPELDKGNKAFSHVTVTVEDAGTILENDSVGVWCQDGSLDEMIDFVPLVNYRDADTLVVVEGMRATISTKLVHIRCPLVFRFMTGDAVLPGVSSWPVHTVGGPSAPYHTRIAYGPDPATQMWVSWTADSNASVPFVKLGTSAGNYSHTYFAAGQPWTSYYPKDICAAPANETIILYYQFPGYFANILITGMSPSTKYYAQYGSDATDSATTTFTTGKGPSPHQLVRVAAFGDMALSPWPGALSTVEAMAALQAQGDPLTGAATATGGLDAVLHFGDLGYAEGSTVIWDVWHTYIQEVSQQLPYHVSQGNHEVDHTTQSCSWDPSGEAGPNGTGFNPSWALNAYGDDSQGEGGVATFHRFRGPGCGGTAASAVAGTDGVRRADTETIAGAGNTIYWYSFSIGALHIIMLDSEHDFTQGSNQFAWLTADLAAVDVKATPWIVVTFHRPMMTPESGDQWTISEGVINHLEPTFVQYGVDIVLGGHVHSYERVCAMIKWECTPRSAGGITYITVGSAGATVHNETMMPGAAVWLQSWRVEWGFGILTAWNESALQWEFFSNTLQKVVDNAWITK